MKLLAVCACVLSVLWVSSADDNLQRWSHWSELGQDVTFTCNDTYGDVFIEATDMLKWRKRGHSAHIMNDDHHELNDEHGIANMVLTLKKVTEQMSGIYVCEVTNSTGDMHYIIKGLNLGGYKYAKNIDKYDSQIITGVIAGAAVCVFIVSVGLIERFRYLTEEQKQKKRERKEEHKANLHRWNDNGHLNEAADLGMTEDTKKSSGDQFANGEQREVNTHL